jgi:hypothetical protein
MLARTGLTTPRSAVRSAPCSTPRSLQLQQLRPGLSLSVLLDAEQGNPHLCDADLPVTVEDAALAFDPSAYFTRGEELVAEDEDEEEEEGQRQGSVASSAQSEGSTG